VRTDTITGGTDGLTGLVDRACFLERLRAVAARGTPAAVCFLDLDGFKLINDRWDHAAGDALACSSRAASATSSPA
jgi:diguanylate cyclase (GGDEF)-like protein